MMDSNEDLAPAAWPAFGAGFSQPYSVGVGKSVQTLEARAVQNQLSDWGAPVHDAGRMVKELPPPAGKTFDEIPLTMEVVIGQAEVPVSTLMSLTRDQVILLNKRFGDPVEIRVNGQAIGRGQIVSDHHDNIIGVKLVEVLRG